ncbi:MAG: hypothetical protein DRP50_09175 [Thermotoga sp.]|nr:MAG: hypothetical protein DRP50_09175 [Thermotoga sp.]
MGRARKSKVLLKGLLNHTAIATALREDIPIEKAISIAERFFGISCDSEQKERIFSAFRLLKGLEISGVELFVKNKKLKLVGRIDAVSNFTPIEIKFGRKTKGDPYQLASYAICMGATKGILVYPDKLLYLEFSKRFLEDTKKLVKRCFLAKKRLLVEENECGNRHIWMLYR